MTDIVEARLAALEQSNVRIEGAIVKMTEAMERLARMEERATEQRDALARAFKTLDKHDSRIGVLEKDIGPVKELRGWAVAGILGLLGLCGTSLASLIFKQFP